MVTGVLHYRHAQLMNRGAERAAARTCAARSRIPSCAASSRRTTRSAASGRRSPTTTSRRSTEPHVHLETTPIDRIDADRHRHRRRAPDRDRHPAAGHRLQPVGRQLPGDRGHRPRGPRPRQVVARQPVPGVRGRDDPALPEPHQPQQPVLLQRPVVLHDDRGADEAHGTGCSARCARRDATTFEVTAAGQRRVPRPDDRRGSATRCSTLGSCATARSYYFNQHGEAALLRPTSTLNARRAAASFPLTDYAYA